MDLQNKKKKRPIVHIKSGDKFGRLTIIEFSHMLHRHKVWKVKCECGTIKTVTGSHMITGNIRSCGYLFEELKRKPPGEAAYRKLFTQYRKNAKNTNREFNLTIEQFKQIASLNCYFCNSFPRKRNPYLKLNGQPKDKPGKAVKQKTIDRAWVNFSGIDRIDSSKGYIIENCIPCCTTCNTMKMDMNIEDFKNHIKNIYLNLNKEIT